MIREASTVDLKGLFQKFIPETIGRFIEAETQGIYPLKGIYCLSNELLVLIMKDCYIRQAKILRRPKFEPYKLAELHQETTKTEDVGAPVQAATTQQPAKEIVGGTLAK